jgi:hypothetical protein
MQTSADLFTLCAHAFSTSSLSGSMLPTLCTFSEQLFLACNRPPRVLLLSLLLSSSTALLPLPMEEEGCVQLSIYELPVCCVFSHNNPYLLYE